VKPEGSEAAMPTTCVFQLDRLNPVYNSGRVHVCGPLGAEKMQCECHKGDKGKVQMA